MKKIIKIVTFLISCFVFCGFLISHQTQLISKAHSESLLEQETLNESTKKTDTVPSRNYTVVIDPGHGGLDVK